METSFKKKNYIKGKNKLSVVWTLVLLHVGRHRVGHTIKKNFIST